MNINQFANSKAGMVVALGAVVMVASYFAAKKVKETAGDIGQAINPVNDDNVFNQGVLAVGRKITGEENWTLGGWIYDITHNDG